MSYCGKQRKVNDRWINESDCGDFEAGNKKWIPGQFIKDKESDT
ncbi:hypothetical protein TBC1_111876 [Lentimicrobium saccharophilum]|uniref:Uncharacterized protein n=1 Tax=Lentimicrobium saccharophilum TaxID=1678841 RepID=A0A0S7C2T9_9BACT|nr:hypothetical protein TBC1_111876 [Lentimicrobium saccharophilum]